jgi:hypothetical protein
MRRTVCTYCHLVLLISTFCWMFGNTHDGYAQQVRWLRVTELQSPVSELGAEYESEFTTGNTNFFSWPAHYGVNQNTTRCRTLWIGCRNFNDPVEGKIKSYKVVGVNSRDHADRPNQVFEQEIKLIGKYDRPVVTGNGLAAGCLDPYDLLDEVDPTLPCDRMVLVKINTSIGVSVSKKVMAFGSSEHDNYFINDYVFKNTGIYNRNGDGLEQTLQDVWFYFSPRYALAGVSCTGYGLGWGSWSSTWGNSLIYRSFGEDPNNPEFTDPSSAITPVMRGFFSWYGPNANDPRPDYDEDWGCPDESGDGTLASAKYVGCATLHADQNSSNPVDDIYQPRTTWYISPDIAIFQANPTQYDEVFMADRYTTMSEGHPLPEQQHYIIVGDDYPINYTDPRRQTGGGVQESQGFGPYTLAPGDSIHIVFAEGVSGISWEKGREVGARWLEWYRGSGTPELVMPDGSTTTNYNQYKKSWCYTGQDSILKTFRAAKRNFESGYNSPLPPPPPAEFTVMSDVHWIRLNWSDNADSHPYFDGYVVYRSEGSVLDWQTVYEKVFECDENNVVHQYDDIATERGIDYYYYIQSKDDASQNDIDPGTPLLSSKFYTITALPANLLIIDEGDYRTHQSGNWNDANSWERYDGTDWVYPAPYTPNITDGVIHILAADTITVTATDSVDQLFIDADAMLVISPGVTLLIGNESEIGIRIEGTVANCGSIIPDSFASVAFGENGTYLHKQNGGSIPQAVWSANSTCRIDSVTTTIPANCKQYFGNLIWNCPNQIQSLSLGWDSVTYGGNLTIQSTGMAALSLCDPDEDNSVTVYMNGDIIQTGGNFSISNTDNAGTAFTFNQTGYLDVSGGNFAVSRGSQGGNGTTTWNIREGNVSLFNCTVQNSNSSGAKFVFWGFTSGTSQMLTLSGVTFGEGGFPVEVESGRRLAMGTSVLRGNGIFNLKRSATLSTAHPAGLDSTLATVGSVTLDQSSNYVFYGSSPQITGTILPDTVASLTVANQGGVTLSHSVRINGTLELQGGVLFLGDHLLEYGPDGSLKYFMGTSFTTTDAEFPAVAGPASLYITAGEITLHASRVLPGSLSLGGKLILGANTLMAGSVLGYNTDRYIVTEGGGSLILPDVGSTDRIFPVGTDLAYAPVNIRNIGTTDTIGVGVVSDNTPAPYGGRVNARWKIHEYNSGDGNYRLRLSWMSSLEDEVFQGDPNNNARIYALADTTEAGSGSYSISTTSTPRYIQRNNVLALDDSFAVGMFRPGTGLADDPATGVPLQFALKQNYPNPFNPVTTLEIHVAEAAEVRLTVFDILGREVALLLNGKKNAGIYRLNWDATAVPSGLYLCRMEAAGFTDTKKMVLLK